VTVRCPRCGTTYRRPARTRFGAEATFRCAHCRHVFEATGEEPALTSGDDDLALEEPAFTFGDEDAPAAAVEQPPPAAPARGTSTARFAVRALLTITLGYAVLSIYLYTHPERVRQSVGGVPFLGPSLVETRVNPASVQLADVHGEYQRVKGDRLVFVIGATAINNAQIPVRGIQLEGRIRGVKEDRQAVFCGAARRDVRDLSLREIALLQALEPPKDWALAPGEQASCLVVFTDPAGDLREFVAEVVAVQAPPRRRPQEG